MSLRVAYFTPLGPMRSGIADYSEELIPDLARLVDLDVVTGENGAVRRETLLPARVVSMTQYEARRAQYDVHVYQVGNNVHHHGYMLPVMARTPGVLVLHDYCLQYLVLGTTVARGDLHGLEDALTPQYGGAARGLARRLLLSAVDPLTLSFAGRLVRASDMVLVHSTYLRDRVQADHPQASVRVVPMGVRESPPPSSEAADRLRAGYGLTASDFVVASVSTPAYNKRLGLLVQAFLRARQKLPNLRLLILGGGSLQREVRAEIARGAGIVHTGWLSARDYRDAIAVSDIVADLRYPAAGETSASLLRALAAGKPAIVSEQGPFTELPDASCLRIPVGADEARQIAGAIERLAADGDLRARMGAAAQGFAREQCAPAQSAAAYASALAERSAKALAERKPADDARLKPSRYVRRGTVSTIYRACRVRHLWRTYGVTDTLRRISEEVRRDA